MDLAKIRKKSLRDTSVSEIVSDSNIAVTTISEKVHVADVASALAVSDSVKEAAQQSVALPAFVTDYVREQPLSVRSPLEAILSGRSAAGCDDETAIDEETMVQAAAETLLEFLCFRVSDEIYGINIMDIKEIIKPREVTEVPRAPVFVSGILSLRGTIIPIIDMRVRLGLPNKETTGKERVIVIKNNNSYSGLLVDEVIQVVQMQKTALEAAPTVLDGIDRDFISGIGRSDSMLIIILNLENVADINLF